MNIYLYGTLILLCFGCVKLEKNAQVDMHPLVENIPEANSDDWAFKKVAGSKLIFKGYREFDTKLYGLEYVGKIPLENKAPFLIFSGIDCTECDAETSLYIHSPDDGELLAVDGRNAYQIPGKRYHYETDSMIYEGRAFYGEVLKNKKGVIWYQNELMEIDRSWKSSIFFMDVSSNSKVESFLEEKGQMKETLALLQEGLCKELTPYNQISMP